MNQPRNEKEEAQPLVCVAFSISAGEPRMMVLRNMVGKLMAWCKEQKLVFEEHSMMSTRINGGGTADGGGGGGSGHSQNPSHALENRLSQAKFVDLFQDEGNRVGFIALWDAFTDLINGKLSFPQTSDVLYCKSKFISDLSNHAH